MEKPRLRIRPASFFSCRKSHRPLDDGLAQRRLRPAVMVAARRVEIGEARVHEQVYHMLDLLDVDLLAAVALDDGQPHEPEAQLPDLVHR